MARISLLLVTVIGFMTAAVVAFDVWLESTVSGNTSLNVYFTGLDENGELVFLQRDGAWFHPDRNLHSDSHVPVPTHVAIPLTDRNDANISFREYLLSGRIWFAVGTLNFSTVLDPHGVVTLVEPSIGLTNDAGQGDTWDFIEFSYGKNGLFINLSFVDFVGLAIKVSLWSTDNSAQEVGGLSDGAIFQICDQLQAESLYSGQPWSELCINDSRGRVVQVQSPQQYSTRDPDAFRSYYDDYVNAAWRTYSKQPLIVDTQSSIGNISCRIIADALTCVGDNRPYHKPTTADVFSCSGPFQTGPDDNNVHLAVTARLCAAFQRSTLLLPDGQVQPFRHSDLYYTEAPTNYYSKWVHHYLADGRGYTFPYDDVSPTRGDDASGLMSSESPLLLKITVGR
jgi:hypothetical protein